MTLKMQSIFTHKGNTHCKNLILSPLKKHKSHSMLPWSEDDVIHELAPHRSKYQGCKEQHICKTMLEDKLLRNILQECVIFMTHYVLLKTYNNKYAFNISKTARNLYTAVTYLKMSKKSKVYWWRQKKGQTK